MTSPQMGFRAPLLAQSARSYLRRLYVIRAVLALLWAVAFSTVSSNLTAVSIGLLIIYPGIDIAASLYDVRTHRPSDAARLQLINSATSLLALIGIAIASADDSGAVLRVFGAWAIVSGVIQFTIAWRRRVKLGTQWAVLISGGLSALAGVVFVVIAGSHDPKLSILSGYAGLGAILFAVAALQLRGSEESLLP